MLTMTSSGEDTEQRELSNVAVENSEWFGYFGKVLQFFFLFPQAPYFRKKK